MVIPKQHSGLVPTGRRELGRKVRGRLAKTRSFPLSS